jgi:exoribonuclease-2
MQLGVKGPPAKMKQWVSHLEPIMKKHSKTLTSFKHDFFWLDQQNSTHTDWRTISHYIQQLKYERDTVAGMQLLAYLLKKRAPQGAFDLLVSLGVWQKHEELALLRSGFPTRFSEEEESLALEIEANNSSDHDIDTILGLRRDLRHLKVYTIDSESTSEIDDGISIERYVSADGNNTDRLWIHIADVDRWAPRSSEIIKTAQRRSTTLYLPTGPIPMFPERYV